VALDPSQLELDPRLAYATTLPSVWYTHPDATQWEADRVFAPSWQYAGAAGKVAERGSYFTADVAGEPVVVLRDHEGTLRAYFNVCRHRGGPVASGEGTAKMLKCAYHGWTYGLDGALRSTPEFAGVQCFAKADFGLKPLAVDTFGPLVFVRMSAQGPDLATWLGEISSETQALPLARLTFFKRLTYEVQCNWKVYVDNYLEGYHIPQVHLGLLREIDYPAYKTEVHRYHSKQHAPVRAREGSLYRRNLRPGETPPEALYYWLFPNVMFNFYPDNLQVNSIVPAGPDKTVTIFDWYLVDQERPGIAAEFSKSFEFSDMVQKEDIAICEQVQKGLSSRSYDRGRYSVEREVGVHHFHALITEFLQKETPR
jgi:choline monooxygenase